MTEYDYSPEALNQYMATQNRIAKWVDTTERHRGEFQAPFGPGGQQQQRPPLESRSSRSTPAPSSSRHRTGRGHSSSRRHHADRYDDSSSDSGSSDSREYGPGPGPMSMSSMPRGLPGTSGALAYPGAHQPHHQQQVYQPMQMQQQYASPHVQIYGAPGAGGSVQVYGGGSSTITPPAPTPAIGGGVRPPMLALPSQTQIYPPPHQSHQQGHGHHHQQMHASYSYAGASSPPLYGYPSGYPMGSPPIIVSAGNSSPARKSASKSKSGSSSRRSRSHQPTSSTGAAAALAAYYAGGAVGYPGVQGYTSPPHTPGYQYPTYPMSGMSSPAATGGGSVSGGYFVPQQYPPMVPMMYRG